MDDTFVCADPAHDRIKKRDRDLIILYRFSQRLEVQWLIERAAFDDTCREQGFPDHPEHARGRTICLTFDFEGA